MFLWNVEKCVRLFEKVYVSSDDKEILSLARKVGAIPIERPEELCGDVPNIPVYKHAVRFMGRIDGFVAVQANSPTVEEKLISEARYLMENGCKELKTWNGNGEYGSIWGMTKKVLMGEDTCEARNVLFDKSIDIHTKRDLELAEKQWI